MKKLYCILFLIGLFFGTSNTFAQVNWIDSVKFKGKIIEANEKNGYIYFKTKKGWGLAINNGKNILAQPIYQFIHPFQTPYQSGFWVVNNNFVGQLDSIGGIVYPTVFKRLGYTNDKNITGDFLIKNDSCYNRNNSGEIEFRARGILADEQSIEIINDKIILTSYRHGYMNERYFSPANDLVDPILETYFEPSICSSGLYDLKKQIWLTDLKYGKIQRVGQVWNARHIAYDSNEVVVNHVVFDKDFLPVYKAKQKGIVLEKKLALQLLQSFSPEENSIEIIDGLGRFVVFKSGNKYGLYKQDNGVVIEPYKYDLIYADSKNEEIIMGVRGDTIDLIDPYFVNPMATLPKGTLTWSRYRSNFDTKKFYSLNGNIKIDPRESDTIVMDGMGANHLNGSIDYRMSLKRDSVFVITETGQAIERVLYPYFRFDEFGTQIDSVAVDENGNMKLDVYGNPQLVFPSPNPGYVIGGVYHVGTGKWIVPKRYSKVYRNPYGFVGYRQYKDSLVYSFYSYDGKNLFKDKTLKEVSLNSKWLSAFVGLSDKEHSKAEVKTLMTYELIELRLLLVKYGKKHGVFNANEMSWISKPQWDFVELNRGINYFNVVDSLNVGLMDVSGNFYFEPIHSSIYMTSDMRYGITDLHKMSEGNSVFIDLDTLVPSRDLVAVMYILGFTNSSFSLGSYVKDKNLYVRESSYLFEQIIKYSEDGEPLEFGNIDSSYSRKIDMASGQVTKIKKAWEFFETATGFISKNSEGTHILNSSGNIELSCSLEDTILFSKNFISKPSKDLSYLQSNDGEIKQNEKISQTYFAYNHHPVGIKYNYYKDKSFLDLPSPYVPLAYAGGDEVLCYAIEQKSSASGFIKRYYYFNSSTKKILPTELELSQGLIRVFPLDDALLLVDYDYSIEKFTCMVLEKDLKTVKSRFKEIDNFKPAATLGVNPIPYFNIHSGKKSMYFDANFQFVFEAYLKETDVDGMISVQDGVDIVTKFQRIEFKEAGRKFVLDWAGNIVNN